MAENKFPIELEFIDNSALDYLRSIRDAAAEAQTAMEQGNQSSAEALSETAKAAKEAGVSEKDLKDSVDKANKSIDNQEQANKSWQRSLKDSAREINILGVNVGATIDKLNAKRTALLGVTRGMNGATKAARVLKVALASTGIGLLVVALGSLITYFTRTQKGLDQMRVALAGVRSVIDNVVDRIARFGGGLSNILKGNFVKGFNEIRDSFSGIGEEMRKDIDAATSLEKRSQKLRDEQRALNLEYEKTRGRIEELRFEARQNADDQEKAISLLQEAARLEDDLAQKRTRLAQENLDITREKNNLAESFVEDLDKEAEAEAELARITQENQRRKRQYYTEQLTYERQIEAANKQKQTDLEGEGKLVDELVSKYKELYGSIQEEINELEYDALTPSQKIEEDQRLALSAIDSLIAKTEAAYREAYGKEIDLTEEKEKAKQLVREKYAQERLDLENGLYEDIDKIEGKQIEELQKSLEGVLEGEEFQLIDPDKVFPENLIEEIRAKLGEALNLDDEQLSVLAQSIGSVFNTFGNAYTDSIDRQLEKNAELIDQLQERKDAAKEALDQEIDDAAAGYANDLESKQQYYDEILSKEEALQQERQELLKKQQQAQLARDIASQVSNLVTAASGFFASSAKLGPVAGIALAATAIGSMYAIMKSARARASESSKLFTGGSLSEVEGGFVKKHGRNDKYNRGYRIEGTNTEVGGNEFLVNQSTALRDSEFLSKYNSGQLDWINFNELARASRRKYKPVTSIMPKVADYNRDIAVSRMNSGANIETALKKVLPDLFNRNVLGITDAIKNRREFVELNGQMYEYRDGFVKKITKVNDF